MEIQDWIDDTLVLEYQEVISSKRLHKDSGQTVDALLMRKGNEVEAHESPYPVHVLVAEGSIALTVENERNLLASGESLWIGKDKLRSIEAISDTKMIIQLIKDEI